MDDEAVALMDYRLAKIKPGEPIFVLRAQDRLAPKIVRAWAQALSQEWVERCDGPIPDRKLAEALAIAEAMDDWAKANGSKVPD